MAKKKGTKPEQPSFDDDEFTFSEDEFGSDDSSAEPEQTSFAPPPEPAKKKSFLSRKKIVGGIVGIVAIIAIFQFLTQQEKSAQPEQPVAEKTTAPRTLTPPPTRAVTPVTAALPATLTPTVNEPPVTLPSTQQATIPTPSTAAMPAPQPSTLTIPGTASLPVTTQQTTTTTTSTSPASMDQVSQAILELRAGFITLSQQFQAMSTQVQQMICNPGEFCSQAKAIPVVKEKAYVAKRIRHRKVAKPLVYHVKALIPGRAWLESNRGTTTSVKVGDTLKNYGQITSINPNTGMVDTSSGRVIKYGRYDS